MLLIPEHGLQSGVQADLQEEVMQVHLDRPGFQVQFGRDVFIHHPGGEQLQDLALPRTEHDGMNPGKANDRNTPPLQGRVTATGPLRPVGHEFLPATAARLGNQYGREIPHAARLPSSRQASSTDLPLPNTISGARKTSGWNLPT